MRVKDLDDGFVFVSDSQDVLALREHLPPEAGDFDAFFILSENGEVSQAFGIQGTVPLLDKRVRRVL